MIRAALFITVLWGIIAVSGCSQEQTVRGVVVYTAETIVTLSDTAPQASAIAIKDGVIAAVGNLEQVKAALDGQNYRVDDRFKDKVLVPGFINQHDHPWLAALTMGSNVISIEDWRMPNAYHPAIRTPEAYKARLKKLVAAHKNPDEIFFTWGQHRLWHGTIGRAELDDISKDVPILIWQRSAHEFMMNTKALEKLGITEELVKSFPPGARLQSSFKRGHFWEQGALAVGQVLFKHIVKPGSFMSSLKLVRNYWHRAGSTLVVEPGGLANRNLQIMQNQIFAGANNPFHMDYIADGKSVAFKHEGKALLRETETLRTWGKGMSRFLPKQVKLFADGAIFSQLMKMKDGYLDGHHGEWIMKPAQFRKAFRTYWDAGYQIHAHQNGDAGLDLVLDVLEENLKRKPRDDHRTVIVHFGFSRPDQVARIKKLGAVVSVNPYYPIALAETYSKVGIGPERAQAMVRLGDLARAGVSFSLHSDMPMAPGRPLYLMWCAVNRMTHEGTVAGPEQKVTAEQALRAVTLEAAYSMRLEKQVGSLEPGKLANITVLEENPLTVEPMKIKDIGVWGTVHEGRVLPVLDGERDVSVGTWEVVSVYGRLIWHGVTGW